MAAGAACRAARAARDVTKHWPGLFPQHGPGRKHERKIALAEWQRIIVEQHPDRLARGLLHSEACRFARRVRRPLKDGDKWYEYPRYMFTNESADISTEPLLAEAGMVGQPRRDQALAQHVFHRLAKAQVNPQRQRRAQLSQPYLRRASARIHLPT